MNTWQIGQCSNVVPYIIQCPAYCQHNLLQIAENGFCNLQTMCTDKWATSKSTQLSTNVWVKLLLLLQNALKLNFEAI